MIRKTTQQFKRTVKTYPARKFNDQHHTELVLRETWWLWFIPLYSREQITASNI